MKIACSLIFGLGAALVAHADFSYTETAKRVTRMPDGTLALGAPDAAASLETARYFLKGQKMKVEGSIPPYPSVGGPESANGRTATITDLDAQIVTVISDRQKNYEVTNLRDLRERVGQAFNRPEVETKVDVKETGQRRTIGGYDASEVVVTMEFASRRAGDSYMRVQAEMDMWLSQDVPGIEEWRAFFRRKQISPWAETTGEANSGMQQVMAALQQKTANLQGFPVLRVIRLKPGTGADASNAGWLETTVEAGDFSSSSIPDSVFAIPADYRFVVRVPAGAVFKAAGGVTAPTLLYKVEPAYTEEASKSKLEGTVVLYVEVDPSGTAVNPKVMRSLGKGLDQKAVEAVRLWKFKPGYKDGKPVTVAVTIEVNFRLK